MAFPSTNRRKTLSRTLDEIQELAANLKLQAQNFSTSLATTNVPALDIVRFGQRLAAAKARFQVAAAMPGLAAFAQEELEDGTLDIAAEFTAMLAEIDAVATWLVANLPATGGYWNIYTDAGVPVTYTPAQTATLRTVLDGLIASID